MDNDKQPNSEKELDLTVNKQEYLRRAIEVGAGALNKLLPFKVDAGKDLLTELQELILDAAKKLREEINK